MTMVPGSSVPVASATVAATHQPMMKTIRVATAIPAAPQWLRIAHAKGTAASDPQVPGANGKRPVPKPVAKSVAGCQSGRPRGRSPTLTFPRARGKEGWGQRQPHGRDRLRSNTLAAAGKAEPVGRRRLNADAGRRDAENCRHLCDHRCPIDADLRALADDRHVDRSDHTPALADEIRGVSEKLVGRSTLPAWVARRGMHPDVALADRSKHRIRQGVETNIGVGVTDEARFVRDLNAADSNMITRAESVHIEALTDANIATPRRDQPLRSG